MIRGLLLAFALLFAAPAAAQTFPALTGRVVDQAELLIPEQEAALTAKAGGARAGLVSRQLVVATVHSLEDHPIEDYGYRLGRHWGIGQREANNGIILLVAPNERKVRIEVGYGLEPIMTDALSQPDHRATRSCRASATTTIPAGSSPAPTRSSSSCRRRPRQAEQRALAAAEAAEARRVGGGGSFLPLIFWVVVLGFVLLPMLVSRLARPQISRAPRAARAGRHLGAGPRQQRLGRQLVAAAARPGAAAAAPGAAAAAAAFRAAAARSAAAARRGDGDAR